MNPSKASNAVVAVVDFYATALAAALAEVEKRDALVAQKDAQILQLGRQLAVQAMAPKPYPALDEARERVIAEAVRLTSTRKLKVLEDLRAEVSSMLARAARAGVE